jgi:hypothetical protein
MIVLRTLDGELMNRQALKADRKSVENWRK